MATLADLVKRFGRLAVELEPRVTRAAADEVGAFLKRQAAAGVTPAGGAWEAKKDGGRALPKAGEHVRVEGRRGKLFVTVEYPYAFHKSKRPMLPTGGEPGIGAAIESAYRRVLGELGFR